MANQGDFHLGEVERYFSNKEEVLLVIVYGSYATGKAGPKSDVDIAIGSELNLSVEAKIEYASELSTLLCREVDVVDLRSAEGLFLHRIMSTGKRVVERKPAGRRLFESLQQRALDFNADFYPILRRDRDRLLHRAFKLKES